MKKILIANRGEIALRIVRACRDAGYQSVVVASETDRHAAHTKLADEVHVLAGNSSRETYLNQQALLDVASKARADAVHPGYGFLSENETFAAAVSAAGLTWIGPSPAAIGLLGNKVSARAVAKSVGVPLLPSLEIGVETPQAIRAFVSEHGLPIIIKAQNGGGGRGMRIVTSEVGIESQLAAAQREAGIAFGRTECFGERYVERARHVEVQCLADSHGHVAVLSTRDCTIQRRHQKLIEEAPAPFLSDEQTELLVRSSRTLIAAAEYTGAATCEFLVTPAGEIYFLEVNTRIQVEHPVTEEICGVDIVRLMFHIAEGESLAADCPALGRHALEFRINAEDLAADFRPSPGLIRKLDLPGGPGVRLDFGYRQGDAVPPHYDSLIGKVIVAGKTRDEAIARAKRALAEINIEGLPTIIPLHRAVLERPEFTAPGGTPFMVYTRWIDNHLGDILGTIAQRSQTTLAESQAQPDISAALPDPTSFVSSTSASYKQGIKAPLSGTLLELRVKVGDVIKPGDEVAIIESMKMEQTVLAETSGSVACILIRPGSFVESDSDIVGID